MSYPNNTSDSFCSGFPSPEKMKGLEMGQTIAEMSKLLAIRLSNSLVLSQAQI